MWREVNQNCWIPLNEKPPPKEEVAKLERDFKFNLGKHWKIFFSVTNGRPPWNNQLIHPSNMIMPIEAWDEATLIMELENAKNKDYNSKGWICIGYCSKKCIVMNKRSLNLSFWSKGKLEPIGTLKQWLSDVKETIAVITSYMLTVGSDSLDKRILQNCKTIEQAQELVEKNPHYCVVLEQWMRCSRQIIDCIKPTLYLLDVSLRNNKVFILENAHNSLQFFTWASRELKRDKEVQQAFLKTYGSFAGVFIDLLS